jgi:cobalt-zinc-cadmium efflux system outer membrane protein
MSVRQGMVLLWGPLLLCGCLYGGREQTNREVCRQAGRLFDPEPADRAPVKPMLPAPNGAARAPVETSADVRTTALLQAEPKQKGPLSFPESLPGAELPLVKLSDDPETRKAQVRQLYPPMAKLPDEPAAVPGPNGQPYTLADLQRLAAEHSPTLREAAADLVTARGNLLTAMAYPNPTVGYEVDPSNDGSSPSVHGFWIDQTIKTAGKVHLATAAAQKDVDNAELALRRARSDLATQVRNAYFALLVARESIRVNRGLAEFTDEVYRYQVRQLELGLAAPAASYEPSALWAQAEIVRLSLTQSIDVYVAAWRQLVAALGLRPEQMPLTEVSGRIDQVFPVYDYRTVLAHVLRNHTDVLTARNGIAKAQYSLKLAQVGTLVPDVDVRVAVLKEYALPPRDIVPTLQVGVPLPVWDQGQGNVLAAEGSLEHALEETHRVETVLTGNLALAFSNYRQNIEAYDSFRNRILPNLARNYRGVVGRRQFDPNAAFADLVAAQQLYASNVSTYLSTLGTLWTAVVSVADLLQTDDLFQLAEPEPLVPLDDLLRLMPLPCVHPHCVTPPKADAPACEGRPDRLPDDPPLGYRLVEPAREAAEAPPQERP